MKKLKELATRAAVNVRGLALKKSKGIDKLLVTMGLCIVALVLCVLMKEELTTFITTIVQNMLTKAQGILGV